MRAAPALALAIFACSTSPAFAQQANPKFSDYELESMKLAVAHVKGEIDPEPTGKVVEDIDYVQFDVFEKRDPAPRLLNVFHKTTRRELIQTLRSTVKIIGRKWDPQIVEQLAILLRGRAQLSLVLCVAIKGSSPGKVRLLVITKDVWSIRLGMDFAYADGKLEKLLLAPAETNIAGTHQSVTATFALDLDTISAGASYSNPTLFFAPLSFSMSTNVITNRLTGVVEGSYGAIDYASPLLTLETKTAWDASVSWRTDIYRRFSAGRLVTYDAKETTTVDAVPWIYSQDVLTGDYHYIRSYGYRTKHDIWFGAFASRRVFHPRPDRAIGFVGKASQPYGIPIPPSPWFGKEALDEFEKEIVPVSDQQIAPYIQYHGYDSKTQTRLNVETLGLQENFRFGHEVFLKVYPVTQALRSTRDFVGVYASGSYALALGDGMAKAIVETTTEFAPATKTAPAIPDGSVLVGARIVSPTTPIGRFLVDSVYLNRYHDYLNLRTSLGGDTRLRGYPTNLLNGKHFFAANAELRTVPIEIWTLQFGGVMFFDMGDAFDDQPTLKESVGLGFRLLIPQLNRMVVRGDLGFPLAPMPGVPVGVPGYIVTFGQAFGGPGVPSPY